MHQSRPIKFQHKFTGVKMSQIWSWFLGHFWQL